MDKTQKFISTAPCGILLEEFWQGHLYYWTLSDQIRMPKPRIAQRR